MWRAYSTPPYTFTTTTGEQSDVVKIRGPKEDVDACHQYLKKMVRDLAESNHQVKVSIFRQFHKFIIGKGGANINKVSGRVGSLVVWLCGWLDQIMNDKY